MGAATLPAWHLAHGGSDCDVPGGQSAELDAALKKAAATQAYVFAVDRPAGGEEPPAREGVALVDAYWLPPDEPLRAIADTAPVPLRRAEAAPNDHQLSRLVDRPWFADLRECSWCVTFSTLIIGATVPGVALFWRSRQ